MKLSPTVSQLLSLFLEVGEMVPVGIIFFYITFLKFNFSGFLSFYFPVVGNWGAVNGQERVFTKFLSFLIACFVLN